MLEINNKYTIEEYARVYNENKKVFKIITLAIVIVGLLSAILGIVFLFVNGNNGFTWMITISVAFAGFFGYELYSLSNGAFIRRLLRMNPALKDGIEIKYSFRDDDLIIDEKMGTTHSSVNKKYNDLYKAKVLNNYIIVYVTNRLATPIKKNELKEEELVLIKNKLNINK